MENITETSVKELLYDKWIFRLEIPNTYWIKLEPIEGSLVEIEEIIARNIKRLKSLNLEENESRPLNEWIYIENTIISIATSSTTGIPNKNNILFFNFILNPPKFLIEL